MTVANYGLLAVHCAEAFIFCVIVIIIQSDTSEALYALASGKGQSVFACSLPHPLEFSQPGSCGAESSLLLFFFLHSCVRLWCCSLMLLLLPPLPMPPCPQKLQSKVGLVHVGFTLLLLT